MKRAALLIVLALPLFAQTTQPVVIRAARMFDGTSDSVTSPGSVTWNRITAAASHPTNIPPTERASLCGSESAQGSAQDHSRTPTNRYIETAQSTEHPSMRGQTFVFGSTETKNPDCTQVC
jgi:hypothetical protein